MQLSQLTAAGQEAASAAVGSINKPGSMSAVGSNPAACCAQRISADRYKLRPCFRIGPHCISLDGCRRLYGTYIRRYQAEGVLDRTVSPGKCHDNFTFYGDEDFFRGVTDGIYKIYN